MIPSSSLLNDLGRMRRVKAKLLRGRYREPGHGAPRDYLADGVSGVGAADADVAEAAAGAQGDGAAVVDAVAADLVVGVAVAVAGDGPRPAA